ncbi:hypothetical protein BHE74_00041905, partial [Ensete ventricosum]
GQRPKPISRQIGTKLGGSLASHQGHLRRNLHPRKAKQRIVVEDVTYNQP